MNITITDRITDLGPYKDLFNKNNFKVNFLDCTNEELFPIDVLENTDALLVWHAKVTEKTIKHLTKCKIVIRYGIGFDQVDGKLLRDKGIAFANNPSYCIEEVADTTIGMILCMTRNISRYNNLAKKYQSGWQQNNLDSWRSQTKMVGIIGLGKIGMAVLNRLKYFGFKIQAYDPYVESGIFRSLGVLQAQTLNSLLQSSDIISLHCPLNEETEGMVDSNFLDQMKPDAILINTARGKILKNLEVLEQHMRLNKNFKAALDVLPVEPPEQDGLIKSWALEEDWLKERLIINPHNAYHSNYAAADQLDHAYETLVKALTENKYTNIVN